MKILVLLLSFVCIAANAHTHKTIYIYNDSGVSAEALGQTLHTTRALLDKQYTIKTINAHQVIQGDWQKDAALFVMPGGADVPYLKKLNGKGNQHIKAFVEQGGAYLGICAGGYYGSQNIAFSEGTPLEIKGARELAFFQGIARGPALSSYDPQSNKGARAATIILSDQKTATVYYYGGSFFEANPLPKNTTVIARYQDLPQQPAAIVKIQVGSGIAILSGVHFDYDPADLDPIDSYQQPVMKILIKHEKERQQLLHSIFSELGL